MHVKFAARIEQTIDGEQFEDFFPRLQTARTGETLAPEDMEAEFLPQTAGGPAVAKTARLAHA